MTRRKRKNHNLPALDFNTFNKKMEEFKHTLFESSFYMKLLEQIRHCFKYMTTAKITSILCYGLGNFTSSITSKYQLALLLLLKEHFDVDVHIYDPVFSETEVNFLTKLEIKIIEKNEEGVRKIENITLIFLPHCPNALINNLLWCNWDTELSNFIVLGNSFKKLAESLIERNFKTKYFYIHSILPAIKELEVENDFTYTDIFNDISLHMFSVKILTEFPKTFWTNKPNPIYNNTDVECISNKLSVECGID